MPTLRFKPAVRGLTGSRRPLYSAGFATPAVWRAPEGPCGGIGRRARLKIEFRKECWFDSGQGHHMRPDWVSRENIRFDFQTTGQCSAFSRRVAPELYWKLVPRKQRARGMPDAQCTRSLVRAGGSKYAHEYSQRRHRITSGIPHAMVLTAYFALSPVTGLFCHRHP
jgi:hypothetical protein